MNYVTRLINTYFDFISSFNQPYWQAYQKNAGSGIDNASRHIAFPAVVQ